MLNRELLKRIEVLEKRIDVLSGSVWGESLSSDRYNRYCKYTRTGLKGELGYLKALLNEVIDHVYAEKK